MPLPFIIAAAAPVVISSTEAVLIGVGSFLGGTVITGVGMGIVAWFRGHHNSLENTHTPLVSVSRQVIEQQHIHMHAEATQAELLSISERSMESAKKDAQEINIVASNLNETTTRILMNFNKVEQSCLNLIESLHDEPEFRDILHNKLSTIKFFEDKCADEPNVLVTLIDDLKKLVDSRYFFRVDDTSITTNTDKEWINSKSCSPI